MSLRLRWSDPSDLLNRGVTRSGDNSCGMELSSQYLFVRIADAPERCDSNIRFPRPKAGGLPEDMDQDEEYGTV